MMNPDHQCPDCNTALASAMPHGLCPCCLMEQALKIEATLLKLICPDCRNVVSVSAELALDDIACPSCDSHFGLGDDENLSWPEPNLVRTISHFELRERLGAGAFGAVWKARDTELDRTVAIKIPRYGQLDPRASDQFLREAKAAARLQHPNIVSVHEVGFENGLIFIVSDCVEGMSLAEWQTTLSPTMREAAVVCSKVADALQHAHEQGIVHRDLKPSNIQMDETSEPHIMDFGLAKFETVDVTMTVEGKVLGTPAYMSPEQARGEALRVDGRTDIYSLGVVLYELLTGEKPFRGNARTLLNQVIHDEPPSPRKLNVAVPRDLETICLKCLEKNRSNRYDSAKHLADDLHRFLSDQPIVARRPSVGQRFQLWCRRSPVVASLTATVALLLVALATGSTIAAWKISEKHVAALANLNRAVNAEQVAHDQTQLAKRRLYDSLVSEAQARHRSNLVGRRFQSLNAISEAVQLLPDLPFSDSEWAAQRLKLRNLAIACLALPDVKQQQVLNVPADRQVYAFDQSHQRLAVTFPGGAIHINQLADDKQLLQLPGEDWNVSEMSFCNRDQYLCARYKRNRAAKLILWDLNRKQKVYDTAIAYTSPSEFSGDGRLLAFVRPDQDIEILNIASLTPTNVFSAPSYPPRAFAFDSSSRMLAIGSPISSSIYLLDVASGAVKRKLENPPSVGVWSLAWHDDLLASGCEDAMIRFWNTQTGNVSLAVNGGAEIVKLGFSEDGEVLASYGWDTTIRLWQTQTGKECVSVPGIPGGPLKFQGQDQSLSYIPDQSRLAVLHVARGLECRARRDVGRVARLTYRAAASDGRLLAVGTRDGVQLWDIPTATPLSLLNESRAAFTSDGQTLITSGNHGLSRWPIRRQEEDDSFVLTVGPPTSIIKDIVGRHFLDLDAQDRQVVFQSSDSVHLASVADTEGQAQTLGRNVTYNCVSLSPNGQWAAAGNFNGKHVQIWDVATGELATKIPVVSARAAFSPDGRWLVVGSGREYAFHQVGTWEVSHTIARLRSGNPKGIVAFDPSSSMLAVTHSIQEVKLVDVETGQEIATLTKPEARTIATLCFSPDGGTLIASYENGLLVFWDLRLTRRRLAELDLDWDLPAISPPSWSGKPPLLRIEAIEQRKSLESVAEQVKTATVEFHPATATPTTLTSRSPAGEL